MLIKVKVFSSSKKEEIIKKSEDSFDVCLKEKPVMGKANKKLIKNFSFYFKIPESKIRIIKGNRKRNKILKINSNN